MNSLPKSWGTIRWTQELSVTLQIVRPVLLKAVKDMKVEVENLTKGVWKEMTTEWNTHCWVRKQTKKEKGLRQLVKSEWGLWNTWQYYLVHTLTCRIIQQKVLFSQIHATMFRRGGTSGLKLTFKRFRQRLIRDDGCTTYKYTKKPLNFKKNENKGMKENNNNKGCVCMCVCV